MLVFIIGLHALFHAPQNIANIDQALGALGYVMSGADHAAYPATLFFHTSSTALHWLALLAVLAGELAVAFFGIKGGWDLFAARNGTIEEVQAAKTAGLWAGGYALLTWFGLFMTFGGAFFQMWQTQVGAGSLADAFKFATLSAIIVMFVYQTPD